MGAAEGGELVSTILEILRKIGNSYDYLHFESKYTKPGITRREFTAILMDQTAPPCYQTSRTVSEKWRLLVDLDYGKLRNSDFMIFNLDKIRHDLDVKVKEGEDE